MSSCSPRAAAIAQHVFLVSRASLPGRGVEGLSKPQDPGFHPGCAEGRCSRSWPGSRSCLVGAAEASAPQEGRPHGLRAGPLCGAWH